MEIVIVLYLLFELYDLVFANLKFLYELWVLEENLQFEGLETSFLKQLPFLGEPSGI
jgi:hypothetical protein